MSFNHKAAYALYSNVKSCNDNGCYDANGNKVEVDMDAINSWVDPDEYKISREMEYPPIQEQLDDIYHNGIDGWKSTIKAIKDKYPKSGG